MRFSRAVSLLGFFVWVTGSVAQPPMPRPGTTRPAPTGAQRPAHPSIRDSARAPRKPALLAIGAGIVLREEHPGAALAVQWDKPCANTALRWGFALNTAAWWNATQPAPQYANIGYEYTAQGYRAALYGRFLYRLGRDSARFRAYAGLEAGPLLDWALGRFQLTEPTPDGGLGRPPVTGEGTLASPQWVVLGLGGQAVAATELRLTPTLYLRLQYSFGGRLWHAAPEVPSGYLTHSLQHWQPLVHTLTAGIAFRPKPVGYTQMPRPGEQGPGGGRGPGGPGGPGGRGPR
jgi:hypothetical protein